MGRKENVETNARIRGIIFKNSLVDTLDVFGEKHE